MDATNFLFIVHKNIFKKTLIKPLNWFRKIYFLLLINCYERKDVSNRQYFKWKLSMFHVKTSIRLFWLRKDRQPFVSNFSPLKKMCGDFSSSMKYKRIISFIFSTKIDFFKSFHRSITEYYKKKRRRSIFFLNCITFFFNSFYTIQRCILLHLYGSIEWEWESLWDIKDRKFNTMKVHPLISNKE